MSTCRMWVCFQKGGNENSSKMSISISVKPLVLYFSRFSKIESKENQLFLNQERTRASSLEEGRGSMCVSHRKSQPQKTRQNHSLAQRPLGISVSDWLLQILGARNNCFQRASCNPLHLACKRFPCVSLNMCIAFYETYIPIVTLASSKWPPKYAVD